jgi:hypothetical protein
MVRLSACALTAGVAAAALAVGAASAPRATLRVSVGDPIHVRGEHFRARELVRVTIAYADVRKARTVRTTRLGTFDASFDVALPLDRCTDSLEATAAGARGDSAREKLPQRACPPAP